MLVTVIIASRKCAGGPAVGILPLLCINGSDAQTGASLRFYAGV